MSRFHLSAFTYRNPIVLALLAAIAGFIVASPGAALGDLNLNVTYETGDFSQWGCPRNVENNYPVCQIYDAAAGTGGHGAAGGPPRVQVDSSQAREGQYSARFELRQNDGAYALPGSDPGNDFSFVNYDGDTEGQPIGQTVWWGFSVRFDPSWPSAAPYAFADWHQKGGCTGPAPINLTAGDFFSINVRGGTCNNWLQSSFSWDESGYRGLTQASGGGNNPPPAGGLRRGVWYDFVMGIRWAPDNSGWIEIWSAPAGSPLKNVVPRTNIPTDYSDGQGIYLKTGIYRLRSVAAPAIMWQDDWRRGSSFDDVANSRPGGSGVATPPPVQQPPVQQPPVQQPPVQQPPATTPPSNSGSVVVAAASSASTGPDMPALTAFNSTTDAGCSACSVSANGSDIHATIGGGADDQDTAYDSSDFGGSSGWSGRLYSRDVVRVPNAQSVSANLSVQQARDVNDALIYELYVDGSSKTLRLWSPAGGLAGSSINADTGISIADGAPHRVEVSALRNSSLQVRVDGTERVSVGNLSGALTANPRFLRVGVDHYDSAGASDGLTVEHGSIGVTTLDWLGTRTVQASGAASAPQVGGGPAGGPAGGPGGSGGSSAGGAGVSASTPTPDPAPKASGGKTSRSIAAQNAGVPVSLSSFRPVGSKRVLLIAKTRPNLRITFALRNRSGRLLGSARTKARGDGLARAAIRIGRWQGQGRIAVNVTVWTTHGSRRISHPVWLSARQLRVLAGR